MWCPAMETGPAGDRAFTLLLEPRATSSRATSLALISPEPFRFRTTVMDWTLALTQPVFRVPEIYWGAAPPPLETQWRLMPGLPVTWERASLSSMAPAILFKIIKFIQMPGLELRSTWVPAISS